MNQPFPPGEEQSSYASFKRQLRRQRQERDRYLGTASTPYEDDLPPGLTFHTYSDAAKRKHRLAYAFVCTHGVRPITSGCGPVTLSQSVMTAELYGIYKALESLTDLPEGAVVVAHSDLCDVKRIVKGKVRYKQYLRRVIPLLRGELERTGARLRFDARGERSHFYTACHRCCTQLTKANAVSSQLRFCGRRREFVRAGPQHPTTRDINRMVAREQ